MRQKNLDLIVAMFTALLNIVWVWLTNPLPIIGIILALPLVFVLPGYTLTEAIFHKRPLDSIVRLVLSLSLSIVLDILGGLFLNLLPTGLQATSWSILLTLLIAVFSLVVAYRRQKAPYPPRGVLLDAAHPRRLHILLHKCLLFGLALMVAILSIFYTVIGAEQQRYPGFTQLWLLPATQSGRGCAINLGVHSFELTTQVYRITTTIDKKPSMAWSTIILAPQQEWNQLVPIISRTADNIFIEVQLYRLDEPRLVYREVHIILHKCIT